MNEISKIENVSEVQIFENERFGKLRTVEIDGEPWFVGKDVAEALGYSNPRKAMLDHIDLEDKIDGVTIRDSIGRPQRPTFINESGIYALIFSSKLPEAKSFKRWVTSEVLPTIRKTGGYVQQGREVEFMKNPNSAIFSAVQSLTMMAEALQMQLENTAPSLPVLSEKSIALWKKNISAPLVNVIADLYNIDFGEAVQKVYERMTFDYGFDKSSVISKFNDKYGREQTEGKVCIDAVADEPAYQRCFVRSAYKLIEICRKKKAAEKEAEETVLAAKVAESEPVVEEPENNIPFFRLGDDYENSISVLAEFLGMNPYSNNTKLRKAIFDRMASDRAWKYSMTHYNCKTKKRLIECNRTYRERFVTVCNAMVTERMENMEGV